MTVVAVTHLASIAPYPSVPFNADMNKRNRLAPLKKPGHHGWDDYCCAVCRRWYRNVTGIQYGMMSRSQDG